MDTVGRPPSVEGDMEVYELEMLDLLSLEGSSPGEGIAGSLRDKDMATCDLRLSDGLRPSLGEPPLARLPDERRDRSARLRDAAAANEVLAILGDGDSCLSGEDMALDIDRGWTGEDAILLSEGGNELRSGGAISLAYEEMVV